MTTLELWLIVAVAILWALGGHIAYEGVIATRSARPSKVAAVTTMVLWPFVTIMAILKPSKMS